MAARRKPSCWSRAFGADDDLAISWVRRARKDGDPWLAGKPPLSSPERYAVRVSGPGGVRAWDVDTSLASYPAAERLADFPAGGEALIEVSQVGPDGQPGAPAALELAIPAP